MRSEILFKYNVPVGANNAEEIYHSEQTKVRKMLLEIDDPLHQRSKVVGSPIKLGSIPADESANPTKTWQHTEEVLANVLGFSTEKIEELKNKEIV